MDTYEQDFIDDAAIESNGEISGEDEATEDPGEISEGAKAAKDPAMLFEEDDLGSGEEMFPKVQPLTAEQK